MQVVNQQAIRETNLEKVFSLIDEKNNQLSRADISKITRLSKTTVSSVVDELIENKYVLDYGVEDYSKQGRKPSILKVDDSYNFVVVINWKKDRIELSIVNLNNEIVYAYKSAMPENAVLVKTTGQLFRQYIEPKLIHSKVLGICVIIPGIINREKNTINSTVLGIEGTNAMAVEIKDEFKGYTVSLLNDTACFTYAEYAQKKDNNVSFIYVNINKGVGAGIFENGHLLSGVTGTKTQFGHFSIDRNGPVCYCGNRGCLERLIGEKHLKERAESKGININYKGDDLLFCDVAEAAELGDTKAKLLIRDLAADTAFAISNMILIIKTPLIIIGGKGINLGEQYLEGIREELKTIGFKDFISDVHIRYSDVGPDAEVYGAAKYFFYHQYNFSSSCDSKFFMG